MYGRQRTRVEILWVKALTNINWKLTVYYEYILTEFEDICPSGCRSCEVEQVKNVETKSWNVSMRKAGSLTYIALPGSQHSTSFCEKENQKTQLQNINIWKPGRFLRGSDLTNIVVIVNVYAPAIAKCLQENLSTSDLPPLSNKQMSLKPM